ncbi:protein LTO1 homolog [Erinaceus europaeus]|uniref:Protein LTO1 homolog n=1 Tax=Erinaceus europaeus TaxID=9365 RepID=A0ABM3W9R1_ERIEU|nr:protein LTO1 homolog [Erinaceus europaeus]
MAGSPDMFDAIVMADERFRGEGFAEGFAEGSGLGLRQGRRLGAARGARVAAEVGCYRGFAVAWRCLLRGGASEKDRKKVKALEALLAMIQRFPYDDAAYGELLRDLDGIRGKFRQLCSLLHVRPDLRIPAEAAGLSF